MDLTIFCHKFVMLFLLVSLCAVVALSNPQNAEDMFKDLSHEKMVDVAIKKITSASRITSNINLFNGLSNDTNQLDDAIAELLNIDTVSLRGLEKFNKSNADAFLKAFKEAINGVRFSEVHLNLMYRHTFQTTWNAIGNLSDSPNDSDWDELAELENWDKDDKLTSSYAELSKLVDSGKPEEITAKLNEFSTAVNSIPNSSKLRSIRATLAKLDKFYKYYKIHRFLGRLRSYRTEYDYFEIGEQLQNLAQASKFNPEINVIASVLNSRFPRSKPTYKDGFGFIQGYYDLKRLYRDTKDTWLQDFLGSRVPINGLWKLIPLKEDMNKLDNKLMEISSKSYYFFMQKLVNVKNWLKNVKSAEEMQSIIIKSEEQCGFAHLKLLERYTKPSNRDRYKDVRWLTRKLKSLESVSNALNDEKKHSFGNTLEKVPEKLPKLKSFIESLKHHFKVLESNGNRSLISSILHEKQDIIFLAENSRKGAISKYLECHKNLTFDSIDATVKLSFTITADDFDTRFAEVSQVLNDSSSMIASIKLFAKNIKRNHAEKARELDKLKFSKQHSKAFSESVQVLTSIRSALEHKADFEKFIESGLVVQSFFDHYSSIHYPLMQTYWGDFRDTVLEIGIFFKSVEEWEREFAIPKNLKFQKFGALLAKLTNISDINLQSENRLTIADWFSHFKDEDTDLTKPRQYLLNFRESLYALSNLDLNFSRHHATLLSMPTVLKHIEEVFKGEAKKEPKAVDKQVNPPPVKFTKYVPQSTWQFVSYNWVFFACRISMNLFIALTWCFCEEDCLYHQIRRDYLKKYN